MLKYLYDQSSDRYTPFIQTPGILKVFKTFVNAAGYQLVDDEDDDYDDDNSTSENVTSTEDMLTVKMDTEEAKLIEEGGFMDDGEL